MIGRILALAVIAAALGQTARIAAMRPVRQELAQVPWLAAAAGIVALAAGALGIWWAMRWPAVIDGAGILAGAAMIGFWWRARPRYGARRGLPPGSLGIQASIAAVGDRDFYRDQARRHGPVFKMSQFGRPVVCVVGLARGRDLLVGQRDALAGAALPYNRFLPRGMLRYMTAEDHRRDGAVFRAAFSGIEFARSEDAARAMCRRMLTELSVASRRAPEGVSPVDAWARWAAEALGRLLFGIAPDDPRLGPLNEARFNVDVEHSGGRAWQVRTEAAFEAATAVIRELAREGAAGTALGGLIATDPAALEDPTRSRNLFLTWRLGTTDLAGLLDWLAAQLAAHPAWLGAVRRAPRTSGPPEGVQASDLASRIVLETLRLERSEYLYRRIVRPLSIDGHAIPAGWLLRFCTQESHRDPDIFPDPDRFDPDRFTGRVYSRNEYAPFGLDTHGCLGVGLVHFLGRIFVEELSHGFDLQVTRDGPLARGSRHRHHWQPSADRRIQLTPVDPAS